MLQVAVVFVLGALAAVALSLFMSSAFADDPGARYWSLVLVPLVAASS
jgi:hypothetical protein